MRQLAEVLGKLEANKSNLWKRYPIKSLAVFGSYARGEQRPGSDIDLLVEFQRPVGMEFLDLADDLEKLMQEHVDLVSRNGVRPSYWEQIKPDLKYV